jgi:hypothetical protein
MRRRHYGRRRFHRRERRWPRCTVAKATTKERLGHRRFSFERFGAGITKLGGDRNGLFWQNEPKTFSIFQRLKKQRYLKPCDYEIEVNLLTPGLVCWFAWSRCDADVARSAELLQLWDESLPLPAHGLQETERECSRRWPSASSSV